jgi:hypothetical protein
MKICLKSSITRLPNRARGADSAQHVNLQSFMKILPKSWQFNGRTELESLDAENLGFSLKIEIYFENPDFVIFIQEAVCTVAASVM